MKIGDLVISPIYSEKKEGRIVNIEKIGNGIICEVFFKLTNELISLNSNSLKKIYSSKDKVNSNKFDNHLLFIIILLVDKIDLLSYQNKIISANNFNIIPLPHQILAVNNVLEHEFKPRCLIADEVGLGKTIEASLIYEELKLRNIVKRILIVAPSGLTTQWKDELKTKFNEDFTIINRETFNGFKEIYGEENIWTHNDKVITSLDFIKPQPLRNNLSEKINNKRIKHNNLLSNNCINANWDMVIFDEAHKLSKSFDTSETARYKIGKGLADATPILLLLTATPHQGDSERFRYLLKLIDEYKFYAKDSINPENVESITIKNNKRAATDFEGNLIFKTRFPKLIKVSREKDDVEYRLYDKVSEYVSKYYDLASKERNFPFMFLLILYQRMVSSSSRAIYASLKKRLDLLKDDNGSISDLKNMNLNEMEEWDAQEVYDGILEFQENKFKENNLKNYSFINKELDILENCVNLAKKSSIGRQDFKIRKLLEIINNTIKEEQNPNTKFIIFTEFIETQKYIVEILENFGYKTTYFNGKMSLTDKISAKNDFKDKCQFLVSTDAGGEGINLQFCHVIINYDLPWNPMKIEQRIGRIDRIGQEHDVKIFNFVLEGTVEERVREVLDNKFDLISKEFGDDKRGDVLSLIQDENNFDEIYMNAILNPDINQEELEKIGNSIYLQAKDILDKQDFLVPFTKMEHNDTIKSYILSDEKILVKNLIKYYCIYKNIDLKEYSKKKNVYYLDGNEDGYKLKNMVFNKDLALENEKYNYINIDHPLVKKIVKEIINFDSFSFNLNINGYSQFIKGYLFYYKLELTNNEGFIKKDIIPIFINENLEYDKNISKWINSQKEFEYNFNNDNYQIQDINKFISKAEIVRDQKVIEFEAKANLELLQKLDMNRIKLEKYYQDKKKAIEKIAIDNIRKTKLKDLENQIYKEKKLNEKKKNLVPKIKLILIAKITLNED